MVPPSNLRTSHRDPLTFDSSIKPRITKKVQKDKSRTNKNNKCNKNSKVVKRHKTSKCTFKCKVTKVNKRFFRKRKKGEKIYKNTEVNEDFIDNKVFSNSYFYRTHYEWNNLPLELKIIEQYDSFMEKLKDHMWESVLDRDPMEVSDLEW